MAPNPEIFHFSFFPGPFNRLARPGPAFAGRNRFPTEGLTINGIVIVLDNHDREKPLMACEIVLKLIKRKR